MIDRESQSGMSHMLLTVVSLYMSVEDNNIPEQNKMFQNKIKRDNNVPETKNCR
ncbi:hypothetical protein C2845_PM09G05950 [Panicum miliaceum]|uniref:Uncharacterized protein n=1 Tax=Panicum miliaceum TaxID=4540 RepID=A0A3L6S3R6_PANMI|nr:hypothetical protein C2845_PM09G05950 [Panicum miliaceum]